MASRYYPQSDIYLTTITATLLVENTARDASLTG